MTTISLKTLQQQFQHYLIDKQNDVRTAIVNTEQLNAEDRLQAYGNSYYWRLMDVLYEDFKGLCRLFDDADCGDMLRDYVQKFPSTSTTVRYVGQHLVKYLKQTYPGKRYLQEMAQFEWALNNAFDAKDEPALTVDDLAKLPQDAWPELTFQLQTSLQVLHLNYNVIPIWLAYDRDDKAPELTTQGEPTAWIVWRQNYINNFQDLNASQWCLFDCLQRGLTFAECCEALSKHMDEEAVPQFAMESLATWVGQGIFTIDAY